MIQRVRPRPCSMAAALVMIASAKGAVASDVKLHTYGSLSADQVHTFGKEGGEIECKQGHHSVARQECRVRFTARALSRVLSNKLELSGKTRLQYQKDGDSRIEVTTDTSVKRTVEIGEHTVPDDVSGSVPWRPIVTVTEWLRYECDYGSDYYRRAGVITYSDPQLYTEVSTKLLLSCVPLSASEAAKQKDGEEAKRRKEKAEEAEALRRASPAFKAAEAASQIRAAQRLIDNAKAAIAEERRIGDISGYVNSARLRAAGAQIVLYEKMQNHQWRIYKANGGKAGSLAILLAQKAPR